MRKIFTLTLFMGFLVVLGFLSKVSAQDVKETTSTVGHLIRVTPKLADIDKTTMYGQPLVKTRDENGRIRGKGLRELKQEIEKKMKEENQRQYNEALSQGMSAPKNQPDLPPGILTPGSTVPVNFNGQTSPGLQPTDNNMAAGPNHLIQAVNNSSGTQFTIYNKAGVAVAGPTIFATVSGIPGDGDPIVLYDQLADRWMIGEFGGVGGINTLIMAVSTTPDPTASWAIYSFTDNTFFPDYPKWSVWHNAYYAYTNDFNNALTAYLGTSVWAFDRAAMIAGNATAAMVRQRLNVSGPFGPFGFMGVVGLEGMVPSSQNGLFLMPNSATQLGIFEVTPNFGASTITVSPVSTIPVNAWATSGSIPQQSGPNLGSISPRMMFKVNYRNNGGTESIVAAHTIANGGLGGVRWYELRRTGGTWGLHQEGNVFGTDGNSRWMPAISMDGCGNIALMYDVAGTGTPAAHPSIRYTGRNPSDPLGQMTLPESVIINAATGSGGISRWGDYNTLVQDYSGAGTPVNGSFWATSQYANQLTRIANFTLTGGCAPEPAIVAGTFTLLTESCVPANGVIDPGETVTGTFCLRNTGTANTGASVTGTMQVSGGIISPSGPQNYGTLVAGGAAVCRDFTFANNSTTCGGTITATIQVQDGANNLGNVAYNFTLGTTNTLLSQNFDGLVVPNLPAGWTATNASGPAPLWVTSNSGTPSPASASAPNAAFINDPGVTSDKRLETPSFSPSFGARVSFSHNFSTETSFDGGSLEISINGGAYQDIVTAGGSFVTGGYTGTTNGGTRAAWTGSSGGAFVNVIANLPASAAGQPTRLRFRMTSDGSVSGAGWRIDNFQVSEPVCCGAPCAITCPADITVNSSASQCGANVTLPAITATGLCGPITYTPASGSFFPLGTTAVTARTATGLSCTFNVTVVDAGAPVITCPANLSVANTPGLCAADNVTYPFPAVSDNCAIPGGTAVPLTQSTNNTTIVPIQIGCQLAGRTAANSWWRAYDLAPLNLPVTGLTISSVRIGIERITTATTVPVTARIYTSNGAFPAGARTLRATQTVNLSAQTGTIVTIPFSTPVVVPANAIVAVELSLPDLQPSNSAFFLGSNNLGQSAPSYISASACGISTPTDLADIGFPDDHIILDINGVYYASAPTLVQTAGLPSGSTFPVGVTTNTFQATDAAGNTSTCSFTVTVNDTEQPVFTTCPAPVTINTDPGVCYATYTPVQPVFSDNCAVTQLTWVMTGETTGSSPAAGINYVPSTQFLLNGTTGTGVTTITYTATDAAGNMTTCTTTVTVKDASFPVISQQPFTKFVCVGSDAVFSVIATTGTGNPLTYQWQTWDGSAWVDIANATAATYTIPAVTFAMNTNTFRVKLTGRCSEVISDVATLYINPLPTVTLVTSIPPSLIPSQSLNITSNVSPAGGTYVWRKNGVVISGASSSALNGLTVDDIGTYRLTYTDPNGCVNTSADLVVSGQASDNLWVYPNPNFGQFQVRFFNAANESATVRVYDAKGAKVYERLVVTSTAYTRIDIDLGPVAAAGIYVVELRNSAGKRVGSKKMDIRRRQ